jgi:hypothetical protein
MSGPWSLRSDHRLFAEPVGRVAAGGAAAATPSVILQRISRGKNKLLQVHCAHDAFYSALRPPVRKTLSAVAFWAADMLS